MTSGKKKKPKKSMQTKIIPMLPADLSSDEEEEGGMFFEKEDIQIIYNALRGYKPTEEELQRYELLLEQFEEILSVDYGEPCQNSN